MERAKTVQRVSGIAQKISEGPYCDQRHITQEKNHWQQGTGFCRETSGRLRNIFTNRLVIFTEVYARRTVCFLGIRQV